MDLVNNVPAESERLNSYEKFRLLILRIYSTFTQSNIGDGAFCKNSWRLKFEAEFAHASIIFQALKMTNIFAFLPPRCCSLCFRYTRDLKFKKGQIQNLTWSSPITQTPFFKGWGVGGGVKFIYLPQRGEPINYTQGVEVFYGGGSFIIFTFILLLRLCYLFEYKFNFFFLHNSTWENHS